MMKLKPIEQQVCVVVGANSGIGRAAALRLADRGAAVVVSGRSLPELEKLVETIRREGGQATAVAAEVTEFNQVKAIADHAVQVFGRIDTWIHSSAVILYAPFKLTTPEEFKRVIEVNLLGQVYGASAALPHLRGEGRGSLILISSIEGRRAVPFQSAYAASKHGLDGFINALRLELQHEGLPINIATILPASINTPLYDKALTKLGVRPRPIPPVYEPEAVAEAILYAAEHPVRSLAVGGAGKALVLVDRLSPRLGDLLLKLLAFRGQRTQQPKPASAPNNLFQHLDGYDTVKGSYSDEARTLSLYTWIQTRPALKGALVVSALAGAILVGGRALRDRR